MQANFAHFTSFGKSKSVKSQRASNGTASEHRIKLIFLHSIGRLRFKNRNDGPVSCKAQGACKFVEVLVVID